MKQLEQYIRDRKSLFEEEPPAGHFERMQQKINRKTKRVNALRWSISIAASITLLFSVGVVWQHITKQESKTVVCENEVDMKNCYLSKMNAVAAQIDMLTKNLDSWDRQQVMADVQNIINEAGSGFEKEIPEELPTNEAKIILSNYYRHNLESLEMVVEDLNIINHPLSQKGERKSPLGI